MQYIKFTYITDPETKGPVYPEVAGLEFVWARESQYPTNNPEFFGTAPDDADLNAEGVISILSESDFNLMRADEMLARNPVPSSCTWRQGQKALLRAGKLDAVNAAIEAIQDQFEKQDALIELGSPTYERASPFLQGMWAQLGGSESELDDLFRLAVTL